MDNIKEYRQPIVTATGIFMGFMLNFAVGWLPDAFRKYIVKDLILSIAILLSIFLLLVVLYRILSMNYPAERIDAYYQRTLKFFIAAISIPFVAFVIIIIRRLIEGTKNFNG